MADTISAYSKTAASNTTLQSISCAEGMAPSDVNNWMRAIMQDLAELYDGTQSLATLKTTTALSAANGSVSAPSLQATADTNSGLYFPAADTVGLTAGGTEQFRFGSNPIPGGSKNLVINGGMTVAQRGSTAITASAYGAVDQWPIHLAASAGRITVTQDSTLGAAVPLGHGFSIKMDCTTAEGSLAAADVITLRHHIEAQNLQHLRYGAATAKTVTLSFWMSSPKSGTHCVALNQPDSSSRHYISEFTVASADTWEHFKISVPGDTGGTINNDTGAGLDINFPLVCGSTFQNTKDTWAAGEDYGSSSVQNLLDNTSNNVYVTGVQLEVGSVATDFAHEGVGTTLAKCQRYFYSTNLYEQSTRWGLGAYDATNALGTRQTFPVQMRVAPTASFTSSAFLSAHNGAYHDTSITISIVEDQFGYQPYISTQSSGTQGEWYWIGNNSGDATTGAVTFTAEL